MKSEHGLHTRSFAPATSVEPAFPPAPAFLAAAPCVADQATTVLPFVTAPVPVIAPPVVAAPPVTTVPARAMAAPRPGRSAHRVLPKPTVRGHTVVSATAALGAVVAGSVMASSPGMSSFGGGAPMDGTEGTDLAAATQALQVRPVSADAAMTRYDTDAPATTMLPVAMPAYRESSVDHRDVESLHKGEKLAAEAATAHALAVREAYILNGGGGLSDWISLALTKMGLDQSLSHGVRQIVMAESRGNPYAVNHSDSNAWAGRPSQGLMQVIPSTFRAYVLPEFRNRPITDPIANITAGVRYMIANYGLSTVRAGGRYSRGSYVGY